MPKPILIAIVGPTASGKTGLAIRLAKKFNGEIISADSRQVYRGMDIGSGKATRIEQRQAPHHLLDVASPKREYNVSHFQRDARRVIRAIHRRGHLPLLVGGTGFWIQAVTDDLDLPRVKPNPRLRAQLMKKSASELFVMLHQLDPGRTRTIDRHNPYRLIRAIEIVKATHRPIPALSRRSPYRVLTLGIALTPTRLHRQISTRLRTRFRAGMVAEVARLHAQGVSWKRLEAFGLEYRFVSRYLRKKITRAELFNELEKAIKHYAKRQLTWFRKNRHIHWIRTETQAQRLIRDFI